MVKNGSIIEVPIKKSAKWHEEPLVYAFDEPYPFSGITENQFTGGQLIEQTPYLSGKFTGPRGAGMNMGFLYILRILLMEKEMVLTFIGLNKQMIQTTIFRLNQNPGNYIQHYG